MIQRIQTIYLFIALALCIVSTIGFMPLGAFMPLSLVVLGIMSAAILLTIFIFKKRTIQRHLCKIIIILTIAWYAYVAALCCRSIWDIVLHAYTALPFIAAIFVGLASRAIKKDDDLVKSVDRLR